MTSLTEILSFPTSEPRHYMKAVFFLLFLCLFANAYAQDEPEEKIDYPRLSSGGGSLEDFIPKGWKILSQTTGDLNKDRQPDVALVLQSTNEKYIVTDKGFGQDTLDTSPRILAVLFGNASAGGYTLTVQSNTFILRHDNPTADEPFSGMEIGKNGVLAVSFHFWYSAGSWFAGSNTYKFRYQHNRFELIGYEGDEFHRASG